MKWIKASERQPKRQVCAKKDDMYGVLFPWFDEEFYFITTDFNERDGVNVTGKLLGIEWLDESESPQPSAPSVSENFIEVEIDTNKYYWCKCENCGWEGSSETLEGCHPIADTGDSTDPLCPVCSCDKIDGDYTIDIPQYEGIFKAKVPLDLILSAYKKTISQLNDIVEDFRWSNNHVLKPSVSAEEIDKKAEKYAESMWGRYYSDIISIDSETPLGEVSKKDFIAGYTQAMQEYAQAQYHPLYNIESEASEIEKEMEAQHGKGYSLSQMEDCYVNGMDEGWKLAMLELGKGLVSISVNMLPYQLELADKYISSLATPPNQ